MSDVIVDVIVPVLNRPQRVQPLWQSFLESRAGVPTQLCFMVSPEDSGEIAEIQRHEVPHVICDWRSGHGDFARKIQLGYDRSEAPFILMAADDLTFHHGWADHAVREADRTGAGVIGTNDLANPMVKHGHHSTHPLIRRSYIEDPGASLDGPGTVLAFCYGHQYVDTELVELAKARGEWAFARRAIVEHNHPFYDKSVDMDTTYEKGQTTSRQDAHLYRTRARQWQLMMRQRRGQPRV